jgi:hypothetical protein
MKLTKVGRWSIGFNELAAPMPIFATTSFSITTMPCECKRWWAWKFYLEHRCPKPVTVGEQHGR